MSLDDGRFLVHHVRFDKLLVKYGSDYIKSQNLVRVDPNFLVVAIGLPVPQYEGYRLDPPLRSRFNCKVLLPQSYQHQIHTYSKLYSNIPLSKLENLVSIFIIFSRKGIQESNLKIPELTGRIDIALEILNWCVDLSPRYITELIYPYLKISSDAEICLVIDSTLTKLFGSSRSLGITLENIEQSSSSSHFAVFKSASSLYKSRIKNLVSKPSTSNLLGISEVLVLSKFSSFCILGARASGKSRLLSLYFDSFAISKTIIPLYKDMSARELLVTRTTNTSGDTTWRYSALVQCAIDGGTAVLDGIENLSFGVLSTLKTLIIEKWIQLPNGELLVNQKRFNELVDIGSTDGVLKISEFFRLICVGRLDGKDKWFSPEICSLLPFLVVDSPSAAIIREIIENIIGDIPLKLEKLFILIEYLINDKTKESQDVQKLMNLRQVIRISQRIHKFDSCLFSEINKCCITRFLSTNLRQYLYKTMIDCNIFAEKFDNSLVF